MSEHVEKIAVIDSILVNKDVFFKYYNISDESGYLCDTEILPVKIEQNTVVHCLQNEEKMLWAMPKNKKGRMQLCEAVKLIDGKWDKPQFLGEELGDGGDANYPYLMQDGITLYYASNGKNSIGGYDIFMTRKDSETGKYLKPQNLGMPYNSKADDYMLVLDDMTGIGWWATDRNNIPNKITIYVFVRNEIRENYDINEPNLASYAKLTDYRATWHGKDYSSLISKIRNLETNDMVKDEHFIFCIKKGLIYTSIGDFKSQEASDKMHELLGLYSDFNDNKKLLKQKRILYNNTVSEEKSELKTEILSLERQIEQLRSNIFKTENLVRTIELEN